AESPSCKSARFILPTPRGGPPPSRGDPTAWPSVNGAVKAPLSARRSDTPRAIRPELATLASRSSRRSAGFLHRSLLDKTPGSYPLHYHLAASWAWFWRTRRLERRYARERGAPGVVAPEAHPSSQRAFFRISCRRGYDRRK